MPFHISPFSPFLPQLRDCMLKKIGKKINFLNRIGNFISTYTGCVIYKSIIAVHFEYCATLIINMGETPLGMLEKGNRTGQ